MIYVWVFGTIGSIQAFGLDLILIKFIGLDLVYGQGIRVALVWFGVVLDFQDKIVLGNFSITQRAEYF